MFCYSKEFLNPSEIANWFSSESDNLSLFNSIIALFLLTTLEVIDILISINLDSLESEFNSAIGFVCEIECS